MSVQPGPNTPVPNTPVPNTPGVLGYFLAVVASDIACGFLLGVPLLLVEGVPEALPIYLPPMILVVAAAGIPVALVGVLAMELLCRRISSQAHHVVVAALAGGLATVVYLPLLGLGDLAGVNGSTAIVVAISAALGRAAVIPVVEDRRRLAVIGRLTGSWRW